MESSMSEMEQEEQKRSDNEKENIRDSLLQSQSIDITDQSVSLVRSEHDVVFTVTIAVAVPTEPEDCSQLKDAQAKSMIDAPNPQNYYHVEYTLLPEEELMKTDVVTYGIACKIYLEKHEAKVIKTWQDGNVTWYSWAHSHTVTVTRSLLLKMLNHVVELRLWTGKEKCSSRARFDRPKAFRLPQPKPGEHPEDMGGVKAMVTNLLKQYTDVLPKKGPLVRPLRSSEVLHKVLNTAARKWLPAAPKMDNNAGRNLDEAEQLEERSSPKQKKKGSPKGKSVKTGGKDDKDGKKQFSDTSKAQAEQIRKYGLCMIPLRFNLLFGSNKTVISRLENPVTGVEDMFFEVSVNSPLLSPSQEDDLNPMMIQVSNATNLPDTPISFTDLQLKCRPAYCKYTFLNEPEHITPGQEQSKNIYWNDTNVFFLGTIDVSQLREYLNGPGIDFEVHDRDRKPELVTLKPTLFGDDLEDEKISHVGTVESRRTLHNPFHKRDKPWDPYGVAKVNLSELLLGCKVLELKIPIINCSIPDILGLIPNKTGKLVGISGAVDGPVDHPLRAGHYVKNNAMLKVIIRLTRPLTTSIKLMSKDHFYTLPVEAAFNRIIFMFDYHNIELLHNLQTLVMSFNAKALGLDTMPQFVIDAALSTYKLSIVQQCRLDLDIVTGFHVLDGMKHIFVLEGLRDKAISILWETLHQPRQPDVSVLYNSSLGFSKRLYGPLDVDLCRVKLHEPLSVIVKQPLLYIRDMVFRTCYDALIKLYQITKMDRMRDVVRNDLFPTAEMIVSLSREFGVPFTQKDLKDLQPSVSEESMEQDAVNEEVTKYSPLCKFPPIDNYNQAYEEYLKRERQPKNYIDKNITDVYNKSLAVHAEREKNKKLCFSIDVDPAYNYSIQFMNSTELVKNHLKQYLREQNPNMVYAYNKEYMSGMFCPVNIDQERKDIEAADRTKWRTKEGWTSTMKKSVRECHTHPQHPDSARVEELKQEWVENVLHANSLKSNLDRDHYPWIDRKKDFELYSKPVPDFGSKVPLSIYPAGVQLIEEKKAASLKEVEDWQSRIVTDDIRQHFHRLLLATEMKMKGFDSSNQLDRLKSLLKDPIRKHGFVVRGSDVSVIPALAVMSGPYMDTSANHCNLPAWNGHLDCSQRKFCGLNPGDLPRSWTMEDNQIPCFDYRHEEFKQLNGYDFNALHKSRNKFSRRPILALRPDERDNHLFRLSLSASPYKRRLPLLAHRLQSGEVVLNHTNHNEVSHESNGLPTGTTELMKGLEPLETSETSKELTSRVNPLDPVDPVQHIPVLD